MDRHRAVAFLVLADALLLALLATTTFLTVLIPSHAQNPEQELLFEDHFDDARVVQDHWELDPRWNVIDGTLMGQ